MNASTLQQFAKMLGGVARQIVDDLWPLVIELQRLSANRLALAALQDVPPPAPQPLTSATIAPARRLPRARQPGSPSWARRKGCP